MITTRRLLACLLLVASSAAGCSVFQRKEPKPEVPLAAGTLLVFPFGDGLQSPLESPRGTTLADILTTLLSRSPQKEKIELISWERLEAAAADTHGDEEPAAEELAKSVGARYLLTGQILHLRTRRPGSVNVLQGEATVEYEVRDLSAGTLVYAGEEVVIYPDDYLGSWGVSSLEESDADVEQGLYVALARKIARHFLPPDAAGDK